MAHTHRDILNHRRRERWRNWTPSDPRLPGAFYFDYSDPVNRYPRLRGGNMVMAPSVSGIWSDERYRSGTDRKAQRRWTKRRERQAWKREVWAELLAEAQPEPIGYEDDAAAEAEWEAWLWELNQPSEDDLWDDADFFDDWPLTSWD